MQSLRFLGACIALLFLPISLMAQQIGDLLPDGNRALEEGIKFYDEGKYAEAVQEFSKITKADTLYASSLYEIALSYQADSAYDKCLEYIDKFLACKTDDRLSALCMKGAVLDKMGKKTESIAFFNEVEQTYGHSYRPFYERSVTRLSNKSYPEVLLDLQNSLLRNPAHPSTHFQIAILANDAGEYALSQMAAFFATMVLNSNQQELLVSGLTIVENTAGGKTDKVNEQVPSELFDFAADLQVIDEILYSGTALNDRYKSKIKNGFSFSKQLQVMCEQLQTVGTTRNPLADFYINFYKSVWKKDLFEGMICSVLGQLDNEKAQALASKYKSDVAKFRAEVVNIISESCSEVSYTNTLGTFKGKPLFREGSVIGLAQFNKAGQMNGECLYVAKNGEVEGFGKFANDKADGPWKLYYSDGTIKKESIYLNGSLEGEQLEYHSNGMIAKKYNAKAGLSVGVIQEFDRMGYPSESYEYDAKGQNINSYYQYDSHDFPNVRLDFSAPNKPFKVTFYKDNGEENYTLDYLNGELNGNVISYGEGDLVSAKGSLVKGERSGYWYIYDDFGVLSEEGSYVNGRKDGEWKTYYTNGQVSDIELYKNGKLNGSSTRFDRYGKKLNEILYRNGRFIELKYFAEDGSVFYESKTVNGVHNVVTYNDLRIKKSEGVIKNEKLEGEWKYYDWNGSLMRVVNYKADEMHGNYTNYHSNGKIQAEYKYVDGNLQGYYREYHENGQVSEEGYYRDGLVTGIVKFYLPDGSLSQERGFWKGELNGEELTYRLGKLQYRVINEYGLTNVIESYDKNGTLIYVSEVPRFKGEVEFFADKGFKSFSVESDRNKYVGEAKSMNADGSIHSTQTYKDGKRNGPYKEFQRGELIEEGNMRDGVRHGISKFYDDGVLDREIHYWEGDRHGKMTWYYPSGKVHQERFYRYERRDSVMTYFNEDGTVKLKLNYADGVLLSYTYPDATGKLKAPIVIKNDSGKVEAFFPNGKKAISFTLVNGEFDGIYQEYYPDGKLMKEYTYSVGMENGISKDYYPNGKIKREEANVESRTHGVTKKYYDNGKLKSEVNYVWNEANGLAKFYTKEGKLESQGEFYDDCYRAN